MSVQQNAILLAFAEWFKTYKSGGLGEAFQAGFKAGQEKERRNQETLAAIARSIATEACQLEQALMRRDSGAMSGNPD
jgi:hypothetical protein